MTDQFFLYLALGLYFAVMLLIGWIAFRRTSSHEGYMLAGRGLPPWVAALSAGASDMSGWLIMGLPGAIFATGLIESWIAVGLLVGSYFNWRLVAPRLRAYTEVSKNSITVPSFFENRTRDKTHLLRSVSSIVILVFFTITSPPAWSLAASSSRARSVASTTSACCSSLPSHSATRCLAGSSELPFTDVVQGLMMVVALVVVPVIAIITIGGWGETVSLVETVGAANLSLFGGAELTAGAVALVIISGLAWGLGYFGQPHIIVRFMALRTPGEAKAARRIATSWQFLSLAGAVAAGLVGIAYFDKFGGAPSDPETIVLLLAQVLLHPLVAGLVLAAVLAAIMSTLSSQLIVCSSALVEDLYRIMRKTPPKEKHLVVLGRLGVLAVAAVAAVLAINPNDSILGLVSFAWAGFGAAFGPIVLLSLYWRKLTNWGALAGMIVGAIVVFVWKALDTGLYELLPGFVIALVAAMVVSRFTYTKNEEIEGEFTTTMSLVLPGAKTAAKQ